MKFLKKEISVILQSLKEILFKYDLALPMKPYFTLLEYGQPQCYNKLRNSCLEI